MDSQGQTILKRVDIVMGSRPDIIKLWPVYKALKERPTIATRLILSGQHIEMADDALEAFDIHPDTCIPLEEMERVNLSYMTGSLIRKFSDIFQSEFDQPEFVIVHGDVVTAFAAANAAFFNKIPVGHVEAGLRTARFESPHPEEGIRRMISRITTLHFAPTPGARVNLLREGNDNSSVFVTGNTVVDSILSIIGSNDQASVDYFLEERLPKRKDVVLITCHRRESWGEPLKKLCETIKAYAQNYPDCTFIWPVHGNPRVSTVVHRELGGQDGVILTGPLPYKEFVTVLNQAQLLVTDSGGVVEEAAYLNIPTLILRNETERPEALTLPNVQLIGYDFELLYNLLKRDSPDMRRGDITGTFGDGYAGERIGRAVTQYLEEGKKNEQIEEGKSNPLVNHTQV